MLEFLEKSYFTPIYSVNVKSSETKSGVKGLMGKSIKALGVMSYLYLNRNISCEMFESIQSELYLENNWNFALYLDECVYQVSHAGSFILVHRSVEDSSNRPDYIKKAISGYIKNISNQNDRFLILKSMQNYQPICRYSLININSSKYRAASVNNTYFEPLKNFTFYSGTIRQILRKPLITFSSNTGTENPPGYAETYQNALYQKGTYFGISYVNSLLTLLPYHDLALFDSVQCGVNAFDYNFSYSCFSMNSKNLGVAYIPTLYSITIPVLDQFKDLNLTTPFISGIGSGSVLSNSTLFPTFKRIDSPIDFTTEIYSKFISLMGWNNIVVFYSNEDFGEMIYSILLKQSYSNNYEILNSEKYRKIDYFFNTSRNMEYSQNIQNAIDTNCNIFVLAMSDPSPFNLIEALYDFGLRRGDITLILFTLTSPSVFLTGASLKRSELMHGSFVIYNAAWKGQFGESVFSLFKSSPYKLDAPMPSFYVDVVLTIAYTSQYLLDQGLSPEDSFSFLQGLKSVKFLGTTGTIKFNSDNNDRSISYFFIYNYFEGPDGWKTQITGVINPLGSVYFTVLNNPVWSNGSFPSDLKPNFLDCPIVLNKVSVSNSSLTVEIGICVFLFIAVVVVVLYDVSKLPKGKIDMIGQQRVPQLEDVLMFWFIFVECGQLVSIGPTNSEKNQYFLNLCNMISLRFTKNEFFRNENYWIAFEAILGVVYFWIFLFFLAVFPCFSGLRIRVKKLLEFLNPVFSNYLYIPVVVGLLSLLSCEFTVGDMSQAFFYYDCSACWDGAYIKKLAEALIVLVFYIPISIYYRTRWQEYKSSINLKASSAYLILRNIFLMVLIIFDKVIKPHSSKTHAVLYCLVLVIMTLHVFYRKAFNYDRANLWIKVLMVCVLWNSCICSVFIFFSIEVWIFICLQIAGLLFLLVVGVYLNSRLPNDYLSFPEEHSISNLFKFAFTGNLGVINMQSEGYSIEIETHRSNNNLRIEDIN